MDTTKTKRVMGKDLRKGDVVRLSEGKCTITRVLKTTRTKGGTPYVFVKYTFSCRRSMGRQSSVELARKARPLFANHLYTVLVSGK